jgi:hypothetical protein
MTAGPRCSESCRSVDCCPSTCKNRPKSTAKLTDQTNASPHCRLSSNSQLPKQGQQAHGARNRATQSIVLQKPAIATNQHQSLCSDQRKRILSNSQSLKRRQRAHGARDRAAQLIGLQIPANRRKTAAISLFRPMQTYHQSSPLFQLTDKEATTADPRCSVSCRSVDCRPSACKVDKQQPTLCSDQSKRITHRRLCSNSQVPKRRQLAHDARNRAGQLIAVQVSAIPRTNRALVRHRTQQVNASLSSHRSNPQGSKRRQLAQGARNQAGQLIGGQFPAIPRTNERWSGQPTANNTDACVVPTHSRLSAVSWPTVLGIVPVS